MAGLCVMQWVGGVSLADNVGLGLALRDVTGGDSSLRYLYLGPWSATSTRARFLVDSECYASALLLTW